VLYDYLRRYIGRYRYAPTLREMQAAVGWQSANSATYYLAQLEEVGLIERDYGASRGIRLVHVA
jgi:SOS-response transcriptional repressor LexA